MGIGNLKARVNTVAALLKVYSAKLVQNVANQKIINFSMCLKVCK